MFQRRASGWLAVGLLTVVLNATGCGGDAARTPAGNTGQLPGTTTSPAQPQAAPVAGFAALPGPWDLLGDQPDRPEPLAAKSASYTLNDLGMDGSDFDPALPLQHESVNGKEVTLTPDFAGQSAEFSGLSYVTYHFQIPGYDRNPQVRLSWSTPPINAADVWLGLSRWSDNHWDWFPGTLSGIVDLPAIEPYFNFSDDLLLVVIRVGTDASTHDEVQIGGPTPVADIAATPALGDVPLNVQLDASASNAIEGNIIRYEWDTDGDGVFETDTGTTPTLDTVYNDNGTWQATVRVTSDINATDTDIVDVVAVGPWLHTLGLAGNDEFSSVAADPDGNIYAAGSFAKPDGPLNYDIVLTKWNPAGNLLWAMTYDGAEDDFCNDLAVNGDGHIILVGSQDLGADRQVLVQKWTAGGQQLWSKRFGGASFDQALDVVTDGSDTYLAGNTSSESATTDVFLCKMLSNGTIEWARTRDFGDYDGLGSLSLKRSLATLTGFVLACEATVSSKMNIVKLEYGTDGSFTSGAQLGSSAQQKRYGKIIRTHNFITAETAYYVSGTIDLGFGAWPFLAKTDGSGTAIFSNAYETASGPQIHDMILDGTGMTICGFMPGGNGQNNVMLLQYDTSSGDVLGAELWGTVSDHQARGYSLLRYRTGMLCTGFAADSNGSWAPLMTDHSVANLNFTTLSGSGTSPSWSTGDSIGTITDIAADTVLDTGAGVNDGLLMYRSVL